MTAGKLFAGVPPQSLFQFLMDFRGKIEPVLRIGFAGGAVEVVVIAHDGHEEILDFQSLFIHLQPVCESVPVVTAVSPSGSDGQKNIFRLLERWGLRTSMTGGPAAGSCEPAQVGRR